MAVTTFKLSDEVKAKIEAKQIELHDLCTYHQIPMFSTVAIENDKNGTKYNNIVYNSTSHDIRLTDDRVAEHMLIASGFRAVPPREVQQIDIGGIAYGFK